MLPVKGSFLFGLITEQTYDAYESLTFILQAAFMPLASSKLPEKQGNNGEELPDQLDEAGKGERMSNAEEQSQNASAQVGDLLSEAANEQQSSMELSAEDITQLLEEAKERKGFSQEEFREQVIDKLQAGVVGVRYEKTLLTKVRKMAIKVLWAAVNKQLLDKEQYKNIYADLIGRTREYTSVAGRSKESARIDDKTLLEIIQRADRRAVIEKVIMFVLERNKTTH